MIWTRDELLFLIVLLINLLIAVVYYLWNAVIVVWIQSRRNKKEAEALYNNRRTHLIRFVVMLLCPVIGPLFFLLSYVFYLMLFWSNVDLEDVVFSKDRVRIQVKADEERERNMVPLEEAISVNDKTDLRMVMLNVLKGDIQDSLSSIALALNIEDSETSHYAASILSDQLNEFRMNVQKLYLEIKADPAVTEYEEMLIDYMDKVLKQQVFTDMEQKRFVQMLDEAAELLYENDCNKLTAQRYESVCMRLLEVKGFENMEKWCGRLMRQYPDQLASYTCNLKLYFTVKNKKAFFNTLNALKKSDVVIDNETLELIRLFS